MIYSSRLRKTLQFLETLYSMHLNDADVHKPVLFSKMALLEYCGWLEVSFDEVARNCVRSHIKAVKDREVLENKIKNTYGFVYEAKFRPLLAVGLGTVRLRQIEKQLDVDGSLQSLRTNLGNLNSMRNDAAHEFTRGTTRTFPTPTVILQNFNDTEPIVRHLWSLVR